MDEIDNIIDRAIEIAEAAESLAPHQAATILQRLMQIADELRDEAPNHPALLRLERYLKDYKL